MDPRDFFRGFFGIPRIPPRSNFPYDDEQFEEIPEDDRQYRGGSFSVFLNPQIMDKFFDQQLDEMLKAFGLGSVSPGIGNENLETEPGTRDFMLKRDTHPGYLKAGHHQKDSEIDAHQVSPEDLSQLYAPVQESPKPQSTFRSFGQSFSSRTVQLPDGSVEEHRSERSNDGLEVNTVTKKSGDECLTVKTTKHPDGRIERDESNACPQVKDFQSFGHQMHIGDSIMDKLFRF